MSISSLAFKALDRGLLERNGRKLELEHKAQSERAFRAIRCYADAMQVIRAGNFSQENAGQKLLKELLAEAKAKTWNGSRATPLDEVRFSTHGSLPPG